MLQLIQTWGLQCLVSLIPGIINVVLASKAVEKRCQKFPLFQPLQSKSFWVLTLIQFALPVMVFWWFAPQVFRIEPPSPDRSPADLLPWALGFGWGFVALLNAPIGLFSFGYVDVNPIYEALLSHAYEGIKRSQRSKTATFWQGLKDELLDTPQLSADRGLAELRNYFELDDPPEHYDPEFAVRKTEIDRKLTAAQTATDTFQQVNLIVKLLKTDGAVDRRDLPERLIAFGCRYRFIDSYFPKK